MSVIGFLAAAQLLYNTQKEIIYPRNILGYHTLFAYTCSYNYCCAYFLYIITQIIANIQKVKPCNPKQYNDNPTYTYFICPMLYIRY